MTAARATSPGAHGEVLSAYLRGRRAAFVGFLTRLVEAESPTHDPRAQEPVQALLREAFEELGYAVRHLPGRETGGHLWMRPRARRRGGPAQLLVGHTDTVFPVGTLARMPVREEEDRLYGPGTADMKGGVTMIVFALRALAELGLEPDVTPVVFLNSDEEIGSPESAPWVARLARRVCRALVLEPARGEDGRIKTARKGVGRFTVTLRGRASHAGLAPEEGASAVHELAHVISELVALNEPARGTTVNVGVVEGGTTANVVADWARAEVDVRVATAEAGSELEEEVRALASRTHGVEVEVQGGIRVPPLERTPRNRRLWEHARAVGVGMGLDLQEIAVGGGSDGNTTSLFTATLDGLGAIGDGLHATHEHIQVDATLERAAFLAALLLAPAEPVGADTRS